MRILCIGDSNTWGFDPCNGLRQENRWTKLLGQMRPKDEIIEEGMCGRTFAFEDPTCVGRCGLDSLPMLLMSHDPIDLVIVMLGTNDLKSLFHARAKAIARGARAFIREIRNPYMYRYSVPKILIIAPILLGEKIAEQEGICGDFDKESLIQSCHLGEEIEMICKEYDTAFLDAAQFANASSLDQVHMDEENHKKLSKAINDKIEKMKD
ncbi:hypothetical protein C815_00011 [Firmicutes bacterium M10-2]|nr:hypothetical protein C815_00011 [Firmicutes bacterium M10-2]